ncbi:hypothetical protein MHYP_G00215670 [Metynnis hypsauchen]
MEWPGGVCLGSSAYRGPVNNNQARLPRLMIQRDYMSARRELEQQTVWSEFFARPLSRCQKGHKPKASTARAEDDVLGFTATNRNMRPLAELQLSALSVSDSSIHIFILFFHIHGKSVG